MSIPRPDLRGEGLLFFFSRKKNGLRWATFSKKILTDEKSDKKKQKKTISEVFAMAHRRRAKFHGSESKKRRGHSPGNKCVFLT